MDFTDVQKSGSRMGTGTMIILDDRTCPVGMVLNLIHFFAQESCGWCTPCWAGLSWCEHMLAAIEEGRGEPEDLDALAWQTEFCAPGNTFCALAPGAVEPLQSALKYFRDDFERHLREKRCPWR
jgi:NADH-quinone oxidoreductase subunit F